MSNWRDSLKNHFDSLKEQKQKKEESQQKLDIVKREFLEKVIMPAYNEIEKELIKHKRKIETHNQLLEVFKVNLEELEFEKLEFSYEIVLRIKNQQIIPFAKIKFWDKSKQAHATDVLVPIKIEQGQQEKYYSINEISKEELIEHIIFKYTHFTGS